MLILRVISSHAQSNFLPCLCCISAVCSCLSFLFQNLSNIFPQERCSSHMPDTSSSVMAGTTSCLGPLPSPLLHPSNPLLKTPTCVLPMPYITCNIMPKDIQLATAYVENFRIHYGKHFILKKNFLFFLLLVVVSVRFFSPPWGQKVPKYVIVSGKIGDRNFRYWQFLHFHLCVNF